MYRASGVVTIGAGGSGLAATGFDLWTWVVLAVALLLVGGVLLRIAALKK